MEEESKRKKTRGLGLPQQQKKLVTLSDEGKKRERKKCSSTTFNFP